MAEKGIDTQIYLNRAMSEADLVIATLRDKGAKVFGKAFGMAGVMIAIAYFGIYKPPQDKISRLTAHIVAAKAMSESGATYQNLRLQLNGSYATLPQLADQKQWLSNAMIDSLRADSLTPESFLPIVETDSSGIIFQTSSVQLSVKFRDAYSWLQRLEGATPLMHVSSIDLVKKPEAVGYNSVAATVMTVIPKKRFN